MEHNIWYAWVAVGISFILLDIVSKKFILASFGVGCIMSGFVCYFGGNLVTELITLSICSIVCYFALRKPILKFCNHYFGDQK